MKRQNIILFRKKISYKPLFLKKMINLRAFLAFIATIIPFKMDKKLLK